MAIGAVEVRVIVNILGNLTQNASCAGLSKYIYIWIYISVQLLEFKIQQEKVLQDDLRTSLDAERARSGTLSGQLNQEKSSNLDLQTNVSGLQVQVGKLKETLEREQSRFVSVT